VKNNENNSRRWGDEAPEWKDIVIVILVIVLLIGLDWIAWFKFGWFHKL
jgi:hypothetical protein